MANDPASIDSGFWQDTHYIQIFPGSGALDQVSIRMHEHQASEIQSEDWATWEITVTDEDGKAESIRISSDEISRFANLVNRIALSYEAYKYQIP